MQQFLNRFGFHRWIGRSGVDRTILHYGRHQFQRRSFDRAHVPYIGRAFSTQDARRGSSFVDPVYQQAQNEGLVKESKGRYDFKAITIFFGTLGVFIYGGYCFVSSCHGRPHQSQINDQRDATTGPRTAVGEPDGTKKLA